MTGKLHNAACRAEHARSRRSRRWPRIVIYRRAALDISQTEFARRMGTSLSVVTPIVGGQHPASAGTLMPVAEALDGRAVLGLAHECKRDPCATCHTPMTLAFTQNSQFAGTSNGAR